MKIWFLIFLFTTFAWGKCQNTQKSFGCVKYIKNYDADTITVTIENVHALLGEKINIRVRGIDSPEIRTKDQCEKSKALEAKKYVQRKLSQAKSIRLENIDRGKYFRIVADVIVDNQNLSQQLLKAGLAYPYQGGSKKKMNWCLPKREIASKYYKN
jgi:micrococcal nuclease